MIRNSKGGKNSRENIQYSVVIVIIGILAAAYVTYSGWDPISEFLGLSNPPAVAPAAEGTVQVHFIDVGQGDCSLILTLETAILIDSGDAKYADFVIQYIRALGVDTLDMIVVTHPHADHIGGMDKIIAAFDTKHLIMPRLPDELVPVTNTFVRMLDAIEAHQVTVNYATPLQHISLGGGATLEFIAPSVEAEFGNVNDYSILTRLVHGENTFLFTGDMEKIAEQDVLTRTTLLSAKVLKIAHHGSKTSSTRAFLAAVNGTYAIISVGSPNRYNHPHPDTTRRLTDMGYDILRTDEMGTIIFESKSNGELRITHTKMLRGNETLESRAIA